MGRPTKYTKELAELICERIATSNRGIVSICESDDTPDYVTVRRWINSNEEFRNMYARAKEDQADYLADEMIRISDTELRTDTEYSGGENSGITTSDNVQRSRLMIESRKWLAMKLKPKKYGDRLDVEHSGTVINVKVQGESE